VMAAASTAAATGVARAPRDRVRDAGSRALAYRRWRRGWGPHGQRRFGGGGGLRRGVDRVIHRPRSPRGRAPARRRARRCSTRSP
jgi:hypothetical protein